MSKVMGLRRSVLKSKGSQNRSKGWRGGWEDRLDIPKAAATPILLTRGEYPLEGKEADDARSDSNPEPMAHFHTCLTHGVKLKPSGPLSYYKARCNIDAGDEDCLLCMARETGDKRVGGSYTYSFNVLHLALYQRVKKMQDGKVVRYDADSDKHKRGDAVLTWEPVTKPRDLKEIREDIDELVQVGLEGEEGGVRLLMKKYVELGRGFRDQLVDIDTQAEKLCKCGGNLTPIAFSCEECEAEIIDVQEANLDDEEVMNYAKERQRCPECGHVGIPVSTPECDECDEPEPLTAFDVVAYVRKKGEKAGTHIVVEKIVRLDKFELEDGTSLLQWEEDEEEGDEFPVLDEDGNWVFTEEHDIRKMVDAGWNFEKVHSPRDHEYNAGRLGISVPPDFVPSTHSLGAQKTGGGGGSKYRGYNRTDRSRVSSEDEEEPKSSKRSRTRRREEEEPEEESRPSRSRGTRTRGGRGRR